jgi:hypothetical protein
MSDWSLQTLLSGLHDDIQQRLATVRRTLAHPGTKGDASEAVWLELLQRYLPERYKASSAHVVDSEGKFSEQIDVVIYDRQYSPFIFQYQGGTVIPAESVYAVFEAKQTISAEQVAYAAKKVASVRRLHRTSLPIPHAGGTFPPKHLQHVIGGLLTFESDWSPGLGGPLKQALAAAPADGRLDLGCVAAHGLFICDEAGQATLSSMDKPATAFLFEVIARLQEKATVPMIDVRSYAAWLHVDVQTRDGRPA